jgi:hypothetical protein
MGRLQTLQLVKEVAKRRSMHPFPTASELQFLVGKELSHIALAAHSVHLHWWNGGVINVTGDIEHVDETGAVHLFDSTAHTGPPLLLHRLIQKKVVMLDVQPLCLTLAFEGGQQLRLRSEEGPYECGVIQFTDDPQDGWIVY